MPQVPTVENILLWPPIWNFWSSLHINNRETSVELQTLDNALLWYLEKQDLKHHEESKK